MSASEIETRVSELLAAAGVTYGVRALGETKREDWVCDEWRCTFSRPRAGGKADVSETFEYFTGTGHRTKMESTAAGRLAAIALRGSNPNSLAWEAARKEYCKPIAPHAAGVLYSLVLDSSAASQSFADWCADFGYDTDSRKALATYEACQQGADNLRRIFTPAEIAALSETLSEY